MIQAPACRSGHAVETTGVEARSAKRPSSADACSLAAFTLSTRSPPECPSVLCSVASGSESGTDDAGASAAVSCWIAVPVTWRTIRAVSVSGADGHGDTAVFSVTVSRPKVRPSAVPPARAVAVSGAVARAEEDVSFAAVLRPREALYAVPQTGRAPESRNNAGGDESGAMVLLLSMRALSARLPVNAVGVPGGGARGKKAAAVAAVSRPRSTFPVGARDAAAAAVSDSGTRGCVTRGDEGVLLTVIPLQDVPPTVAPAGCWALVAVDDSSNDGAAASLSFFLTPQSASFLPLMSPGLFAASTSVSSLSLPASLPNTALSSGVDTAASAASARFLSLRGSVSLAVLFGFRFRFRVAWTFFDAAAHEFFTAFLVVLDVLPFVEKPSVPAVGAPEDLPSGIR